MGAPSFERFQASAAKQIRTAFFWVITQRVVVISCRHYHYYQFLPLEDGADKLSRNIDKELPPLAT